MSPLYLKIDDSFYLPEERDGYMVSSEMKKVWAVELDLLDALSRVCEKHRLRWFVHAGTMLGAVRHHGFIPWDDDIDVVMPREDYERLCELGPYAFSHPHFFQNENTDPFFARTFSRLRNSETTAIIESEREFRFPFNQGVFIDIFPIDHVPAEREERNAYYDKLNNLTSHSRLWRNMIHFYRPKTGKGWIKRTNYYLKHLYFKYLSPRGYQYYLEQHHEWVTRYDAEDTGWIGESIIAPLGRHVWRTEWVHETILVPFEMLEVPVPVHYEECLAASFGKDWKIPRHVINHHGFVFFDTEKPYTTYFHKSHV